MRFLLRVLFVVGVLGWASERIGFGQVMDKRVLTLDGAKKVAAAAAAEARRNNEGLYRIRLKIPGIRP